MYPDHRAQRLLAIAAICIILTSLLPVYFKTFFVEESGRMNLISPWFAALLLFALFYKRHWARRLTLVICYLLAFGLFITIIGNRAHDYKSMGVFFLLLLQVVTILILRDRDVKDFLYE